MGSGLYDSLKRLDEDIVSLERENERKRNEIIKLENQIALLVDKGREYQPASSELHNTVESLEFMVGIKRERVSHLKKILEKWQGKISELIR